jgi:hypothetical protein
MVALYPGYCEKFGWMLDESAVKTMTAKNAEKIKELDAKYVREPRAIPARAHEESLPGEDLPLLRSRRRQKLTVPPLLALSQDQGCGG